MSKTAAPKQVEPPVIQNEEPDKYEELNTSGELAEEGNQVTLDPELDLDDLDEVSEKLHLAKQQGSNRPAQSPDYCDQNPSLSRHL